MKTLYFIGNEELWNASWFKSLVENLKETPSLSVVLYDEKSDLAHIKGLVSKLSPSSKAIIQENISLEKCFGQAESEFSKVSLSYIYQFAREANPLNSIKEISDALSARELLEEISLAGVSMIVADDFLFDLNLSGGDEHSSEKPNNDKTIIDEAALLVDSAEVSRLIEVAKEPENTDSHQASSFVIENTDQGSAPAVFHEIKEEKKAEEEKSEIAFEDKTSLSVSEENVNDLKIESIEGPSYEGNSLSSRNNDSEIVVDKKDKSVIEVENLISAISPEISNQDLEVLRKYALIKERELKEAVGAQEALRRQIRYIDERLKKSEEERRKLQLKFEEVENSLRTVMDKKDEGRAQIKNIEAHYEEKIKELQIQNESAHFQASKLGKKLEDFRERVRTDLQKIRSRERELSSRLEIQKRDAEALLNAKDERLINQKKEIDRIEFELDSLRERLLDEAQRSEDRRKRVSRAIQSLKLSQSILSSLEEEGIVIKDDKAA